MRFILLFLIILTIHIDINKDKPTEQNHPNYYYDQSSKSFQVISYKLQGEDTFISVMDQLHRDIEMINIEQMMNDFQALNPKTDIYKLEKNKTYLFPVYN